MGAGADPALVIDRGARVDDDASLETGLRAYGRMDQNLQPGPSVASVAT